MGEAQDSPAVERQGISFGSVGLEPLSAGMPSISIGLDSQSFVGIGEIEHPPTMPEFDRVLR